ncbi:MAG: hypothetical protein ACLF0P_05480 [Thermoanaerobaculia bacterium]
MDAAKNGGEQARQALARLWLSEGIPYAFRDCPAVYESMRSWLANRLGVHAKEISVAGSARLGASLSPVKLGRPFGSKSDLDVFVVSAQLFEIVRKEFCRWSLDFESGRVKPRNAREEGFWQDNNYRGDKLIRRGFIDQKLIPNLDAYADIRNISESMWALAQKLNVTERAPRPKRASTRCYKSWDAFVRQAALNLT